MRLGLAYSCLAINNHFSARIPEKNNRIETYSLASALCLWHYCITYAFLTLDFSTSGPISFSNSPDCTKILFSECCIHNELRIKFWRIHLEPFMNLAHLHISQKRAEQAIKALHSLSDA